MAESSDLEKVLEVLTPSENALLMVFRDTGKDSMTPEEVIENGQRQWKGLVEVMNAASWLKSKGILDIREKVVTTVSLAREGETYASGKLPEEEVLEAVLSGTTSMKDLMSSGMDKGTVKIGITNLKSLGVDIKGGNVVVGDAEAIREAINRRKATLAMIAEKGTVDAEELDDDMLDHLKSRKNVIHVKERIKRNLILTDNGKELISRFGDRLAVVESVGQLTPELISTGKWRKVNIRKYDIDAFVPRSDLGKLHPMKELIRHIREIFLSMGFTEIKGNYVHSAFWNMDALFIPQDHPAREMQDTLYTVNPERISINDKHLVSRVKAIHENGGGTGSKGWGYEWSQEVAERALLRTHTTVETIRYLSSHPEPPVKVFSIDRVFRNEALDSTHLPEFHQIEGIIMEENASFSMLIGVIKEFYKKMGFQDVRVRPAYFPYTEPSLEVEVQFEGRWLELGGAGIFRPEVTAPFNIQHPVLAWGLGLERLAMLIFDLDDIRDLYMSDIDWLKKAPVTILKR